MVSCVSDDDFLLYLINHNDYIGIDSWCFDVSTEYVFDYDFLLKPNNHMITMMMLMFFCI